MALPRRRYDVAHDGTVSENTVSKPDPTVLTTEQILREVSSVRDFLGVRIDGLEKVFDVHRNSMNQQPTETEKQIIHLRDVLTARIEAISSDLTLLRSELQRQPTLIDKQVDHLRGESEVKFSSIQTQFRERDGRATASEDSAKTAVNAALQAQKEAAAAQNDANSAAITKSEATTVKQIDGILALLASNTKAIGEKIDGILVLLASNTKAIDEKIASINGRLDRGDGSATAHTSSQGTLFAIAGLGVAILVAAFTILRPSSAPNPTINPPYYNQTVPYTPQTPYVPPAH